MSTPNNDFLTPNDPFKRKPAAAPKRGIPLPKIKPKKKKVEEVVVEAVEESASAEPAVEAAKTVEATPTVTSTASTSTATVSSTIAKPSTARPTATATTTTASTARPTATATTTTATTTTSTSTARPATTATTTTSARPATTATTTTSARPATTATTTTSATTTSTSTATPRATTTSTTSTASTSSAKSSEPQADIKLTESEFNPLRDFIHKVSGIFITDSRKYLIENRLSGHVHALGLKSFTEYHNYLLTKDPKKEEINKLFERITTNETFFFRNIPQLDTIRDVLFKKVIEENKDKRKIRIWSAGCSSGEEPYTIAIMLAELLGSELSRWDIKITANDLSPAVLEIAKKGEYNEYTLRMTPPEYLPKYFDKHDAVYQVKPILKKMITFGQINLNESSQTKNVETSQIIFCRNVIIYFNDEVKTNVITNFYNNLQDGGSLVIGHSESLHNIKNDFTAKHHPGTLIFTK